MPASFQPRAIVSVLHRPCCACHTSLQSSKHAFSQFAIAEKWVTQCAVRLQCRAPLVWPCESIFRRAGHNALLSVHSINAAARSQKDGSLTIATLAETGTCSSTLVYECRANVRSLIPYWSMRLGTRLCGARKQDTSQYEPRCNKHTTRHTHTSTHHLICALGVAG